MPRAYIANTLFSMYRKKNREIQVEKVKISPEKPVAENHILRAIDKAIDFNFICEEVEGLYGT